MASPAATFPGTPSAQRWFAFGASLLGLIALGWIDYTTGYELSLVVFYSGPVGIAAWYAGRWPGVAMALLAALACTFADKLDGLKYSNHFYFYWNLGVHFAVFAINAIAAAKIRGAMDDRDRLAREVEQLKSARVCPKCGGDR